MGLSFGTNDISEVDFGSTSIGEIWLGNTQLWSSQPATEPDEFNLWIVNSYKWGDLYRLARGSNTWTKIGRQSYSYIDARRCAAINHADYIHSIYDFYGLVYGPNNTGGWPYAYCSAISNTVNNVDSIAAGKINGQYCVSALAMYNDTTPVIYRSTDSGETFSVGTDSSFLIQPDKTYICNGKIFFSQYSRYTSGAMTYKLFYIGASSIVNTFSIALDDYQFLGSGLIYYKNKYYFYWRTYNGLHKVSYSSNLTSWTTVDTNVSFMSYLNDYFATNGTILCGISNYTLYTSTDGINFTSTNLAAESVAYGNGRFITADGYGVSYQSTDGSNWTALSGLDLSDDYYTAALHYIEP